MNIAALLSLLARVVLPVAVLLVLYVVNQTAEQRGYDKALLQAKTGEVAQLTSAIERSRQLADQMGQILERNNKDKADAKKSIDTLAADLRSGAVRLSIATTGQPAANGNGATTGPGQARAELDPAAAEALVRITADGDDAIRDLNSCIAQYDAVRGAKGAANAQAN